MKQQAILKAIREACPELMEFRKGCMFYDPKTVDWARNIELICYNPKNGIAYFTEPDGSVFHCQKRVYETFITIGHEPHLEHFLRAMRSKMRLPLRTMDGRDNTLLLGDTETALKDFKTYDLTLSLRQNLETNQELTDFLYKLLVKE